MRNRIISLYPKEKIGGAITLDYAQNKSDALTAKINFMEELKAKYAGNSYDRRPDSSAESKYTPEKISSGFSLINIDRQSRTIETFPYHSQENKTVSISMIKDYIKNLPAKNNLKSTPDTPIRPEPITLPAMPIIKKEPTIWERAKQTARRGWDYLKSWF